MPLGEKRTGTLKKGSAVNGRGGIRLSIDTLIQEVDKGRSSGSGATTANHTNEKKRGRSLYGTEAGGPIRGRQIRGDTRP